MFSLFGISRAQWDFSSQCRAAALSLALLILLGLSGTTFTASNFNVPSATVGRLSALHAAHSPAVPDGLYAALAKAETADDADAYVITGGQGANPAQGFGLRFSAAGAKVWLGSGAAFDLTVSAYGYGAALQPVSATDPEFANNGVE